ncbi:MobF family relaxase [Phytomonospora sp. NPDC050363]|uniref:MobF family relaxase n=1 Tax=Phytomonospora sp. NPDC050363 TaxID=3155642 RepID=UPI0033FE88A1
MVMQKLTVGNGYTYLTRNIAGGDGQRIKGQDAADYYVASGNPPGVWLGRGSEVLGLSGQEVSEEQMRHLFAEGRHPNADKVIDAYLAEHGRPGMTPREKNELVAEAAKAASLGRRFGRYKVLPGFEERVTTSVEKLEAEAGRAATAEEIARVRRDEAKRQQQSATAGFDLVFTPIKSAAILHGLDERGWVREAILAAHKDAIAEAMAFLEEHAAFTRAGAGGPAQVDTTGLVAVAFDHFDSRDGDPNLHTHVVISNKIQAVDGSWKALDARPLHRLTVAASERYNTSLHDGLATRLGVGFTTRQEADGSRQVVREIDGVAPELLSLLSKRHAALVARHDQLTAQYRAEHGRTPDEDTAYKLRRQATLETRHQKGAPRTHAEMRAAWRTETWWHLGSKALAQLDAVVSGPGNRVRHEGHRSVSIAAVDLAAQVVENVSATRAVWTRWNLVAETERLARTVDGLTAGQRRVLIDEAVGHATSEALSIHITPDPDAVPVPAALRRADGTSVFVEHGAEKYTSTANLDAEARLVTAAETVTGITMTAEDVAKAVEAFQARTGRVLDDGQRALVEAFATDSRLLTVGIGPAGAGKSTAMAAYTDVLRQAGRRVIALAPSATAASALAGELGVSADTIHKFLYEHRQGLHTAALEGRALVPAHLAGLVVRPGDVILVDEAGMAGTPHLDAITDLAARHGATVRFVGDYRQLGAMASGGALALIAREAGAVELTDLHRFRDPHEARATLAMREGHSAALDHYQQHGRIVGGEKDAMTEAVYAAWMNDRRAGKNSLMIALSNADVTALSARARDDLRRAGLVENVGVVLRDGNRAGKGDWIVTRDNNRRLTTHGGREWVRNGDMWRVLHRHDDGALVVENRGHHGRLVLPSTYVTEHVELAYATTVRRIQGATVDTAHLLITDAWTREALYVAASRAKDATRFYVTTHIATDDPEQRLNRPKTDPKAYQAREILEAVVNRATNPDAATDEIRRMHAEASSLATLLPRLAHAMEVAAGRDEPHRDTIAASAGLPPWVRVPARLLEDPEWGDYLTEQASRIVARSQTLTQQAIQDHPEWIKGFGEPPAEPDRRTAWCEQIGIAAAYREQFAVTSNDPAHPIGGYITKTHPQRAAYQAADHAIQLARRITNPDPRVYDKYLADQAAQAAWEARQVERRAAGYTPRPRVPQQSIQQRRDQVDRPVHQPRQAAPQQPPTPRSVPQYDQSVDMAPSQSRPTMPTQRP